MIREKYLNEIIVLTSYDWEFSEHYIYNAKEMPDKKELDKIWKTAKSKIKSGIQTEPNPDEILIEMVNLLKEKNIYPLKIWNYDVRDKRIKELDSL